MKPPHASDACRPAAPIALLEAGAPVAVERVDLATRTTASGSDFRTIRPGAVRYARSILAFVLLCATSGTALAQDVVVSELIAKSLPDFPGKQGLLITVDYAPGAADPVHRHDAHGFIYVLEGSVVMQVKGGPEVTLTPGQTFYENPTDVHVVGRNASQTRPARLLVFLLKPDGAPVLVPEE
jgi:quercetin dioxygenase-like cupin family protein